MGSNKAQKNRQNQNRQNQNKQNQNKQEQERISFLEEEMEEIKEIVERKPEQKKETKPAENRYAVLWNKAKQIATKNVSAAVKWLGTVCRDARSLVIFGGVLGLGLLIAVIVLAVRLGGVTKELESVQAMSVSLQEELATAKQELSENQKLLLTKDSQQVQKVTMMPTVTPVPTATPIPTATPVVKKYVVCVDAGHGDWDGGAVFRDEAGRELRDEKNDNLRMSKWFREALETYGVEVILTRETDVYLELKERTAIANNANADVLISFHRNSFNGEDDVRGVEFWIHSSQPQGAKELANSMLDAIMEVGGMPDRGVKYGSMDSLREDFEINRSAKMTSMIVELGFISSAADNEAYDAHGKEYAEKMAKAVYDWLEAQNATEE